MAQANINNFVSQFRKTELARPYNFDVTIYPSSSFLSTITGSSLLGKLFLAKIFSDGKTFKTKCEAAELPARMFSVVDQKTYGPLERTPIQNSYGPISLSFLCSDDMSEKKFFDNWMEVISISNPLGSVAGVVDELISDALGIDLGIGTRYDFLYKDDYSSSIELTQYNLSGSASYKVLLMEAWPFAVEAMPLRWSSGSEYHRVNVSFYYKYFISRSV